VCGEGGRGWGEGRVASYNQANMANVKIKPYNTETEKRIINFRENPFSYHNETVHINAPQIR
jgi:hypothetical protein